MIAVSFALPTESSGVLRHLTSKRTANADGTTIFRGEIDGREVAVFHTGVGRAHCQRNVQAALAAVRPRLFISAGFAGSITDRLEVGDLLVAQNFSDWGLAKQILEGGSASNSPETSGPARFHPAILFTSSRVIESSEERRQIAQAHRADAIDMETEVIATACAVQRIPMISLRVITDAPAAPFPAPAEVLFDVARQRIPLGKLGMYLLAHPSAVKPFIRFAKQISTARARLTTALVDVIPRLDSRNQ